MNAIEIASHVAGLITAGLLNGIWLGTFLVLLVACALRMLRKINASTRYAIWIGTLFALLVVLVSQLVLSWRSHSASRRQSGGWTSLELPSLPVQTGALPPTRPATEPRLMPSLPDAALEPSIITPVSRSVGNKGTVPVRIQGDWTVWFVAAWVLAALAGCGRIAVAYWQLRRLRTKTRPAPSDWQERLRSLCERNQA
jgi:hypothetical protein